MTTDELLKPRYKVIADFPGNWNQIGDIIITDFVYVDKKKVPITNFPAIFKPLQWWEEREASEMPQYVKIMGRVEPFEAFKDLWSNYLAQTKNNFQPATLDEYNSFINQKPKTNG